MGGSLQPLLETKLLAVLRGVPPEQVLPLAGSLAAGGVRAVEVSLDSPGALESIRLLRQQGGPGLLVGAGGVLDASACERAIGAGAQLISTVAVLTDVAAICRENLVPCMLGAATPTEVMAAYRAGSSAVRFCPADLLGTHMLAAVKAALPHVPLVAAGGLGLHNAVDFVRAGADAVAVSGAMVEGVEVAAAAWPVLAERARQLIGSVR